MLENDLHVGRFAQDANVRQDSVVHQVMGADTVAAVLSAAKFFPLRFFNLASNRRKNDIALKSYSRSLQCLYRVGITNQRALHVVNAEAVNHSVLDHSAGFVADSSEELLMAGIRRVHVAVEHQAATSASALPAADYVGTAFLDLLPGNVEAHGFPRGAHVLGHFGLVAGGAWNIDDVAAHGHDFFFLHLGEDSLNQLDR